MENNLDQEQQNGNGRRGSRHKQPFNPNEHMSQLKTREGYKDYLAVQWRLVWFRTECPQGVIETEMIHFDPDRETEEEGFAWNEEKRRSEKIIKRALGFALFKAKVQDGKGGIGTGTKSEKAASFPDYIEKAETGAIGRALATLGYGTQFTGDELDEGHRIADAPVDRGTTTTNQTSTSGTGGQPQRTHGLQPTIDKYHERAKTLGLAWDTWTRDVLKKAVPDASLSPQQVVDLGKSLTLAEAEAKKKSQQAPTEGS